MERQNEHMKPIIPFEPVVAEEIPTSSAWVGQVKWDGVRVLTYYDGQKIKMHNRRLNERTFHYPELQNIGEYCSATSVILDGEVIALKNGKPSFYEVMKRDGITNLQKVEMVRKSVPIIYMIFDIVFYNEKWIVSEPLSVRQKILEKIITPNGQVQLVESFQNSKALFKVVKEQELEGIVVKDLTSSYIISGKDGRWRKKKFYQDLIAVVGGVTYRGNIVNSLLLGLYDREERLWFIGHVGGGKLTQKDWRDLSEVIKPLIQPENPFFNHSASYKEPAWLKPELTVKIKFAEWVKGHTLRNPSIEAFTNIAAKNCLLDQ